jgi:hypothetical protein
MFEIHVLPGRQLIQSTLAGFLEVDEVRDYAREMTSAHRAWIRSGAAYRLVINAKDARIQTQEVLSAFAAHIASYPAAEKIGIVYGASLTRFQILRLLDRPYALVTDDLRKAQMWALDDVSIEPTELRLVASGVRRPVSVSAG